MKKENSIWDHPDRVLAGFIFSTIVLWTLQCSLLQSVLSIDIYETIVWGGQMQWGHTKHPPLSGWIGYFFSWATGHSDWGMYFAAQFCLGLGVWFTFRLARLFFDGYRAAVAALMLYLLFFYTPSETKFSTYFVEIAIAPLAAYTLLLAVREGSLPRWLSLGAICALGILNKYSFGLILAAFALIVLSRREYRRSLATPGPYLAFLVFLLMISPHLKWVYEHNFICFTHVAMRMEETHSRLMPLMVLGVAAYPLLAELLALMLAKFPFGARGKGAEEREENGFRRALGFPRHFFAEGARTEEDRKALHFAAILTLFPAAFYFTISLFGSDIILMWMCTIFSASGIMILALFPVGIDRVVFRRFSMILVIFIACVFAATTADSLLRTSITMHLNPGEVVRQTEAFWRRHSPCDPVPVVVGELRYAALFSHYSDAHPPVCEVEDEIMFHLYRDTIRHHGALLLSNRPEDFDLFYKWSGREKVKLTRYFVNCRSLLGEHRKKRFFVGYLPPEGKEREAAGERTGKIGAGIHAPHVSAPEERLLPHRSRGNFSDRKGVSAGVSPLPACADRAGREDLRRDR